MASSSSSFPSLPHRAHASPTSSSSSSSSSDHEPPQQSRRITLTIPPLRLKPLKPPPPSEDVPSSRSPAAPKPPTKIKLKPRASVNVIQTQSTAPATPIAGPSVPPPPPPVLEKPKPPPRPTKLKPLREILSKLIVQIKKKDDYAFFLQPVDASQVQGYSDVVKNPMDFGTMTSKVDKGRYRSLDEFMADFRLVIANAQAFNPPETLYYTEAARIEHYGLEQIAKASAHVIEFEADWTIDPTVDADVDQSGSAGIDAMDVDDEANIGEGCSANGRKRSQSITSSAQGPAVIPLTEKARRSRKKIPMVTESWEPGGHLPGCSDGIGGFPSGSEMADIMMQLKSRGKLFRNKKEKMRFERSGIPYNPDGSLAYSLMERPFTMLSNLVPDPLSVPELTPLIITEANIPDITEETASQPETSQPPEERLQDDVKLRGPVSLPADKVQFVVRSGKGDPVANRTTGPYYTTPKRRKHWSIMKTPAPRSRARDVDDVEESYFKRLKLPEPTDYGSYAMLLGTIAAENGIQASDFDRYFGSDEKELGIIRSGLRVPPGSDTIDNHELTEDNVQYDAESYIRNVVYGGIDGLSYIRSLAEFCGAHCSKALKLEDNQVIGQLGSPLSQWVETNIIDALTEGNHSILRDTANSLIGGVSESLSIKPETLADYIASALVDKKELKATIAELYRLTSSDSQIDIASLLKAPHELFVAESEWAGASYKTQKERERDCHDISVDATEILAKAIEDHEAATKAELQEMGTNDLPASDFASDSAVTTINTQEIVRHALIRGAESLLDLDSRLRKGEFPQDELADRNESVDMKRTRLNLIAIAKRAPIEMIARLPPELVPPHIRHIVPTLST